MATKLNNEHIEIIMNKSKSYNIFDTYIALAHISYRGIFRRIQIFEIF